MTAPSRSRWEIPNLPRDGVDQPEPRAPLAHASSRAPGGATATPRRSTPARRPRRAAPGSATRAQARARAGEGHQVDLRRARRELAGGARRSARRGIARVVLEPAEPLLGGAPDDPAVAQHRRGRAVGLGDAESTIMAGPVYRPAPPATARVRGAAAVPSAAHTSCTPERRGRWRPAAAARSPPASRSSVQSAQNVGIAGRLEPGAARCPTPRGRQDRVAAPRSKSSANDRVEAAATRARACEIVERAHRAAASRSVSQRGATAGRARLVLAAEVDARSRRPSPRGATASSSAPTRQLDLLDMFAEALDQLRRTRPWRRRPSAATSARCGSRSRGVRSGGTSAGDLPVRIAARAGACPGSRSS